MCNADIRRVLICKEQKVEAIKVKESHLDIYPLADIHRRVYRDPKKKKKKKKKNKKNIVSIISVRII